MSAHRLFVSTVWSALALTLGASTASSQPPTRIVSLAPSITEVLFEIGLGPRVVGVTSYCRFPPAALSVAKIGGYLTPSYEAIAALRPDLAVLLPEHADIETHVAALHVPIVRVDHRSIDGVIRSMLTLGARCGTTAAAGAAVDRLSRHLDRASRIAGAGIRPRVLLCFGRTEGFRRVYAAAPGTIHDDLLRRAGGRNVLTAGAISYPTLSVEGLLRLDPDVIVELATGRGDAAALQAEWRALASLRAVQSRRVYVFTEEFLSVPGPRFVRFSEVLARALAGHPKEITP